MPERHIGEAEVQLPSFLTSALDRGEWSISCCSCFISTDRAPDTV